MDLGARVAALETALDKALVALEKANAQIAHLEAALEAARRGGKRQAAPFAKGAPKRDPEPPGRKSGEAHGRHGHREIPGRHDVELDAEVEDRCECGGDIIADGEAFQYSVDLPPVRPVITRFRVEIGHCAGCGRRHQGRHPLQTSDALGAAGSQVGPRAKAWGVWLHYGLGLSFAKCSEVLQRLGVMISPSALVQAAASTSSDLAEVYDALIGDVNNSDMVVMDETGWHVGGFNNWLWVATTPDTTVYNIAFGRSHNQAIELLGIDYTGVLVRDGWHSYRPYTCTHQTCVAHLLRRCNDMITDLPDEHTMTPLAVSAVLQTALDARELPLTQRQEIAADLARRLGHLCQRPQHHPANTRLVKHLERESHALFTFLTHDNIDAANWRAEQAIRPAVVNRKVWGGNRTRQGALTQSRLMSTLRTAHQRGIDIIDYLIDNARAPNLALAPTR